ncbi:MAG: hypothetical protein IPM57_08225 [Oligoflexia bacterium]|nr:hypothetical protein [Oligoflexia bacterium]
MKKTLIAFSISLLTANFVNAATQNTAQVGQTPEPSKKIFTGSLLIETSGTLSQQSASSSGEDYSFSGLYRVDLGASLSDVFTASLRAGYSQEYSYVLPDGSSGDLTDSRLGLTAALGEIRKDLKLSVSSSLTLPASRISQRAGLYSVLALNAKLIQTLNKFTFILSPGVSNSFHSVEVQNDGRLNNEHSINVLLSVAYSLRENLEFSVSFQPTRSWTYRGTTRDKYFINYEVGYTPLKNLSLALGIYNDASALKSNGIDYNYALFDQQQFMGYFDITLSL